MYLEAKWRVILSAILIYVGFAGGTEKRTCLKQVEYTVKEGWWPFKWDVLKTRDGIFCCTGYNPVFNKKQHFQEVKSDAHCEPFCGATCPAHSTCLPPKTCECVHSSQFYARHYDKNRCTCNEGFMLTDKNQCKAICPDHCTNGKCTGQKCTCNEGYKSDGLQQCVPHCPNSCVEGEECTGPGECSPKACEKQGFERNDMGRCLPKCSAGCQNGNCTAPDNCICNDGYAMNAITSMCEAQCDNCTNGFCLVPQECICNMGFKKVEGACIEMSSSGEALEDPSDGISVWLLVGLCVGLVVVATVAAVGFYARIKTLAKHKMDTESPIALEQIPRTMLQLPEAEEEEEVDQENELYGRF